jgi:hypothetical protein
MYAAFTNPTETRYRQNAYMLWQLCNLNRWHHFSYTTLGQNIPLSVQNLKAKSWCVHSCRNPPPNPEPSLAAQEKSDNHNDKPIVLTLKLAQCQIPHAHTEIGRPLNTTQTPNIHADSRTYAMHNCEEIYTHGRRGGGKW